MPYSSEPKGSHDMSHNGNVPIVHDFLYLLIWERNEMYIFNGTMWMKHW